MKIRILAFATAAEALGGREIELEVPAGTRVSDLAGRMAEDHPALAPLWPRLAVAVDGQLAQTSTVIAAGAEVALLPPVSGG
ncbi:MAG: MoaD/ThiS family protein [Acidobacteriota bacterium]